MPLASQIDRLLYLGKIYSNAAKNDWNATIEIQQARALQAGVITRIGQKYLYV